MRLMMMMTIGKVSCLLRLLARARGKHLTGCGLEIRGEKRRGMRARE